MTCTQHVENILEIVNNTFHIVQQHAENYTKRLLQWYTHTMLVSQWPCDWTFHEDNDMTFCSPAEYGFEQYFES